MKVAEPVQRLVRKFEVGLAPTDGLHDRPVRDPAEGQHHRAFGQRVQFVCQEPVAGVDLRADRLVIGRQALDGIGDAAIRQLQIIVCGKRLCVRAEAELVQHLVQQDPGVIARERPARPVRTVHAGRQPDDQETRLRIAKRRHRPTVIVRVALLHVIKEPGKPRAGPALGIEDQVAQFSAIRVVHMANDRVAKAARAHEVRARHEVVEFLLHILFTVRAVFAFRLLNGLA